MNYKKNSNPKLEQGKLSQGKVGQRKVGQGKLGFSLLELSIVLIIISLLMVAVIKGSDLIGQAKLAAAGQLTVASPVLNIKGLLMWYETTLSKSFIDSEVKDNSLISTWYDIANPPRTTKNMLQTTPANQPTYKSGAINDLPALYFDGTSDYMVNATSSIDTNILSPQSRNTIFIVMRYISGTVIFQIQNSITNRISLENSAGSVRWDFPNSAEGGLVGTSNMLQKSIILTLDKNSTTQSIFINGAIDNSQSNALTLTPFISNITIAADTNGVQFSQMYISELIIYDRSLSTQERKDVERYLGRKYNIIVP